MRRNEISFYAFIFLQKDKSRKTAQRKGGGGKWLMELGFDI